MTRAALVLTLLLWPAVAYAGPGVVPTNLGQALDAEEDGAGDEDPS